MTGLLLVNKPSGMTSHDVVDRVRRVAGTRRVGHTGTLDPGATGLLILCLGKATRLSEHLTGMDKVYEGTMRFGVITDSYDLDGEVAEEHPVPALTTQQIQARCNHYVGIIEQIPPMVSAVKIGGQRLYKRARKGEVVERPPRQVTVNAFEVLDYAAPDATFRVRCSSGTYVRSLCHEVGQDFGCGAALASLCRTAVGRHSLTDAIALDDLADSTVVQERLISMNHALDLPEVVVVPGSHPVVSTGGILTQKDLDGPCPVMEGWVQVKSASGTLLALGVAEASAAGARIHPKRVFMG